MSTTTIPERRREGMRAAAPLTVAAAAFGIAFGVLARSAGFDPLAAVVFSATTFGGSAQFAAATVVETGGGVGAAVAAAALLNSRYLPMGLAVAPAMSGTALRRLLRAQLVVDESWALARTRDGFDAARLVGAGIVFYTAWVAGTGVGAFAASVIADPQMLGLDAAFPALFLALLASALRRPHGDTAAQRADRGLLTAALRRASRLDPLAAAVAVIAAGIALALTPVLPPGLPLVVAGAAALLGLRPRTSAGGGR